MLLQKRTLHFNKNISSVGCTTFTQPLLEFPVIVQSSSVPQNWTRHFFTRTFDSSRTRWYKGIQIEARLEHVCHVCSVVDPFKQHRRNFRAPRNSDYKFASPGNIVLAVARDNKFYRSPWPANEQTARTRTYNGHWLLIQRRIDERTITRTRGAAGLPRLEVALSRLSLMHLPR